MAFEFSYDALKSAADALGWQVEMVSALSKKEVQKNPFFMHGGKELQKLLFERHKFWRHLALNGIDPDELIRRDPSLRDILGKTPYPAKGYGKFIAQYQRRERASAIHREAALSACSYTGFQILGENYAECGYGSVESFVDAMQDTDNWLAAMVALVKKKGIEDKLTPHRLDFAGFAEKWNGPDYWRQKYDIELSRLYQRELAASLPKPDTKLAALAASKTVQRAGATVAAGTVPGVGVLLESDNIQQMLETAKQAGAAVTEINSLAGNIAEQLAWLPWAVGGQSVLVVLLGATLAYRYLHDRGYV